MKRYFNERTVQVLLCGVLVAVAAVTWRYTHSALLCMLACMAYTAAWIGIGFWATRQRGRVKPPDVKPGGKVQEVARR